MSDFRYQWLGWMTMPLFGDDYTVFSWMVVPGFTFAAGNTADALLCRAMPARYRTGGWLMVAENAALAVLLFHLKGFFSAGNLAVVFALAFALKLATAGAALAANRWARPGPPRASPFGLMAALALRGVGTGLVVAVMEVGRPEFGVVDHVYGTLVFWDLAVWLAIVIGHWLILARRPGLPLWTGSPVASAIEVTALIAVFTTVSMTELRGLFPHHRNELGIVMWFTFVRTLITATSLVLQWKLSRQPNAVSLRADAVFVVGRAAVGACAVQLLLHYLS